MNCQSFRGVGAALAVLLWATQLAACATSDFDPARVTRQAEDVPEFFLVARPGEEGTRPAQPGEGCRSPMVDPRSGRRIDMVRSSDSQGDYVVPDSAYGLADNELLRLDCSSGRVLGVVLR